MADNVTGGRTARASGGRAGYIRRVLTDSLPHSLDPLAFPYPALAALAARLPHGGGREVALAALMAARLSHQLQASSTTPPSDRTARATAAKVWLASLALPANTRVPFARCIDATTSTPLQVAGALRSLVAVTSGHLDGASVQELERLSRQLAGTR
jgi:hypothetical protein